MKRLSSLSFFIFFIGSLHSQPKSNPLEKEFFSYMDSNSENYKKKYSNKIYYAKLNMLKDLYIKNDYKKIKTDKVRIPKIIHQIWVGQDPIPNFFKVFRKSWIEHHPDWEYKLWTNKDVEKLNLVNRKLYNQVKHPREKANILRYELLYQLGGLYVDGDFLCLTPFHKLNYCDFYVGISANDAKAIINNGLIACTPGHPIMKHIVHHINSKIPNRASRSGVDYFSKEVLKVIKKAPGINIAFPVNFFYSVPKSGIAFNSKKDLFKFLNPQSMALHYWASSWNKEIEKLIISLKKKPKTEALKTTKLYSREYIDFDKYLK